MKVGRVLVARFDSLKTYKLDGRFSKMLEVQEERYERYSSLRSLSRY